MVNIYLNYIKLDLYGAEEYFFFDRRDAAKSLEAYNEAMTMKLGRGPRLALRGANVQGNHAPHLSIWKRCNGVPAAVPEIGEYVQYVLTEDASSN